MNKILQYVWYMKLVEHLVLKSFTMKFEEFEFEEII